MPLASSQAAMRGMPIGRVVRRSVAALLLLLLSPVILAVSQKAAPTTTSAMPSAAAKVAVPNVLGIASATAILLLGTVLTTKAVISL